MSYLSLPKHTKSKGGKGKKKKKPDANSPCHDLDGRKTKTCAELNGILMNLFMTGNNLDCIKNMSGP